MMFILHPSERIKLRHIHSLDSCLVKNPLSSYVTDTDLSAAVDNSKFCQVADFLSPDNYCFFIDKNVEENYDAFTRWIRDMKEDSTRNDDINIVICKKTHMIRTSTYVNSRSGAAVPSEEELSLEELDAIANGEEDVLFER